VISLAEGNAEFGHLSVDVLFATDVTEVNLYYPGLEGTISHSVAVVANGRITDSYGGGGCADSMLAEFDRADGTKSYLVPWSARPLNHDQIAPEVTVNDLVSLAVTAHGPRCVASQIQPWGVPGDIKSINVLDSVRLTDGSQGRLLSVFSSSTTMLAWVPPGDYQPATFSTGNLYAFTLASAGRSPILVALSPGPATTVPTLPVVGHGKGFTVFGQPGKRTAVVTSDDSGQPLYAVVVDGP
jgi:hypothetical protein